MKRLFLLCLIMFSQFQFSIVYAENVDVSQYVEENRMLRKNIIDLKHDFYSFKVQQEKLAEVQSKTGSDYSWLFLTLLFLSLFFIWQVVRNLRVPLQQFSEKKVDSFLKKQSKFLTSFEDKLNLIKNVENSEGKQPKKFLEGVVENLEKLLKKEPKNDKYLYEKAEAEALLEKKVSALQDLRSAVEINPKWKKEAQASSYFQKIKNFIEFKKIVGE